MFILVDFAVLLGVHFKLVLASDMQDHVSNTGTLCMMRMQCMAHKLTHAQICVRHAFTHLEILSLQQKCPPRIGHVIGPKCSLGLGGGEDQESRKSALLQRAAVLKIVTSCLTLPDTN